MAACLSYPECRQDLEQLRHELMSSYGQIETDVEEELRTCIESLEWYVAQGCADECDTPVVSRRSIDLMSHASVQTTRSGIILRTNRAFTMAMGLAPRTRLAQRPLLLFISREDRRRFIAEFFAAQQRYVAPRDWTSFRFMRSDGSMVRGELCGHGVRGQEGALLGMVWRIKVPTGNAL